MNNVHSDAFIHENAIIEEGAIVGAKTRVWAFTHILSGAVIGEDCNICDHVFIENDVTTGDRVTIKCGVYLWDGICLADDVFVGPSVTFTNDKLPRSKRYPVSFACTNIDRGASIGANATILPDLRIGSNAMVGAGAVVTRSVPSNAIVVGNPARIVGYVDTLSRGLLDTGSEMDKAASKVRGVVIHRLNHVGDLRGDLCVAEWDKDIPFIPARVFFVYNVPGKRIRGEHAHKECHQFLVCVKGSLSVVAEDGKVREEYVLDRPWVGLHLPPKTWGVQYKYSQDAVLMVFASHPYDAADYIRDYGQFLEFVKENT